MKREVCLSVLGVWDEERDIRKELLLNGGDFTFTVGRLRSNKIDNLIFATLHDREDDIVEQLSILGRRQFTEHDLELAENHSSLLYINIEINTIEDLINVMDIGKAILDTGGIAIKIHSSGVAFTREKWFELRDLIHLRNSKFLYYLYLTFINIYAEFESLETVGMGTFDLPDVVLNLSDGDIKELQRLANAVNLHQIVDGLRFYEGYLFIEEETGFEYRFSFFAEDRRFGKDDVRLNKYGFWRLERLS
jgi:hypothetical protein